MRREFNEIEKYNAACNFLNSSNNSHLKFTFA